jgi:hypothetical protein
VGDAMLRWKAMKGWQKGGLTGVLVYWAICFFAHTHYMTRFVAPDGDTGQFFSFIAGMPMTLLPFFLNDYASILLILLFGSVQWFIWGVIFVVTFVYFPRLVSVKK